MKRLWTVFSVIFLVISLSASVLADRKGKKEVQQELQEAAAAIKKVESLKVTDFPYELGQARYFFQVAEEKFSDGDKDWASHYADLSRIAAETAYYRAQEKSLAWQRISEELDLWRKLAEENEGEVAKKVRKLEREILDAKTNYAVMSAGFESSENIKTLTLKDRETLIKITFSLKESAPVAASDFLKVLSWIPEARFTVRSHTSRADKEFVMSAAKGQGAKQVLMEAGVPENRIQVEFLGDSEPLMENGKPARGAKNDRIEILVKLEEETLSFIWGDRPFWMKKGKDWLLSPKAFLSLSDLREIFPYLSGLEVEVQGHTSRMDEDHFSLAKAVLMKDYLTQKGGIPSSRIEINALGNTKPLMNGARPVSGRANDRVALILKKNGAGQEFIFSDSSLIQNGGISIRLSQEGFKKVQEAAKEMVSFRVPKSRIVIEAHTSRPDSKDQEGSLKGSMVRDLLSEMMKVIPGDFTLVPMSNKKPLKVEGRAVRGAENDRIEIVFSVGRKYILPLQDERLFLKKSLMISDQGKFFLDKVHELFQLIPGAKLLIQGHTALRDKDKALSKSKAESVRDYFVNVKGISSSVIRTEEWGDEQPLEIGGKVVRGKDNDRVSMIIEIPKDL